MKTFYTVDRNNSLYKNQIIDIYTHHYQVPYQVPYLFHKNMSYHGFNFLNINLYINNYDTYSIEIIAEYLRRQKYPNLPSRFQSLYAVDNLSNANDFNIDFFNGKGKIWEVCTNNLFFKGDMNLLNLKYDLSDYWAGKKSNNPFWEYLLTSPITVKREIKISRNGQKYRLHYL